VRLRLFATAQFSVVPMMFAVKSWVVSVAISVPVEAAPGVGEPVTAGAMLAISGAFWSAAASASVNGCARGPLGTVTACDTIVMLLATGSMRASTEFFTPRPQAANSTTAETPMIRPSMVNDERSQCARSARSATNNASHRLIADLPPRHHVARRRLLLPITRDRRTRKRSGELPANSLISSRCVDYGRPGSDQPARRQQVTFYALSAISFVETGIRTAQDTSANSTRTEMRCTGGKQLANTDVRTAPAASTTPLPTHPTPPVDLPPSAKQPVEPQGGHS
jgi:hypothetical protein